MWKTAAALLAGVLLLLSLQTLPSSTLAWTFCLPFCLLALFWRPARRLLALPAGFLWAWFVASQCLSHQLNPTLEGKVTPVTGWVCSLPKADDGLVSFEFCVESLDGHSPGPGIPARVDLGWSHPFRMPTAGEHWRFTAKLHRPRGYMNPGGFDYEGWLFRRGIGATGYVLHEAAARFDDAPRYPLLRARERVREAIAGALVGNEFAGVIAALAVGDQSGIGAAQWQVFANTGTVHLVAIAGLHIGTVAGFVFLLLRLFWRRSAWLCEHCPAPLAAGTGAVLAAAAYAALAGFSLPTQRALIMLAAASLGLLLRQRLRSADVLSIALIAVLAISPLSAGEISFWLSFGAVAAILLAFNGRLHLRHDWLSHMLRTQWAIGIGLLPLLVFFFHRAAWPGPFANLVVVPVYCFTVVPLVLLGVATIPLWPTGSAVLLKTATGIVSLTWPLLDRLAGLEAAAPAQSPGLAAVGAAVAGALWLLMPRGMPARWLGGVCLLALVIPQAEAPAPGAYTLTLLDVGQGLSAVVRTARHTLVYDTGPRFYSGSDTGERVVIPYLQAEGIGIPDLTVVSHRDNDHAGGLGSLRQAYPGMPVVASAPAHLPATQPCWRGQAWDWDGVRFQVLYPDRDVPFEGNDASCVLRVSGAGGSVLLTGDIMHDAEQRLLAFGPATLDSDVLVAPHHGSNSSSGADFVAAVSPQWVLFPVGYRNRWGFPKSQVVRRYREAGAKLEDTATDGAIRIGFRPGQGPGVDFRYRLDSGHLWTAH